MIDTILFLLELWLQIIIIIMTNGFIFIYLFMVMEIVEDRQEDHGNGRAYAAEGQDNRATLYLFIYTLR